MIGYSFFYEYLFASRLATGWKVRGSNPGGGEIFRTYSYRLRSPPSLLYNGYRFFPGGKSGLDVVLTTHPHLVLWFTKTNRGILLFSVRGLHGP